jgi:hypothetical protein
VFEESSFDYKTVIDGPGDLKRGQILVRIVMNRIVIEGEYEKWKI